MYYASVLTFVAVRSSSTAALLVCYLLLVLTHLYYPKWRQAGPEATLSYDVSGYYMYLPAVFIYRDLQQVAFLPDVIAKYRPTGDAYQTFAHESGNQVMKYSLGQAIAFSPFFALAHAYALASDTYPADGFSLPYQIGISLGSLLVGFLGLFVLMRLLRHYFSTGTVAVSLLVITFATNYLNYTAIDGAMTHNFVFTYYALLLLATHHLYAGKAKHRAWLFPGIGILIGWMALTRPTEIIAAILPLTWGLELSVDNLSKRWSFFRHHLPGLVIAVVCCGLVGSLQLLYWHYVSGEWIVYSYQEQGFDWFEPHVMEGLFSYKAGWLIYTPVMALALLGFVFLYFRRQGLFVAAILHTLLFLYLAFAWSIWWYGGSLGQRTMVQAYAVLALPLAAFLSWVGDRSAWWKGLCACFLLFCTAHNLWFTHQAHRGGLFVTEWMNEAYYWRTLFTFEVNPEDQLLLDNPEHFRGLPERIDTLYTNNFDTAASASCGLEPITGPGSLCLLDEVQGTEEYRVAGPFAAERWIRASFTARIQEPRWYIHHSAQLILRFYRNGELLKERIVRMHRVLNGEPTHEISIEARTPPEGADEVAVAVWNGGNDKPALLLDDLLITTLR